VASSTALSPSFHCCCNSINTSIVKIVPVLPFFILVCIVLNLFVHRKTLLHFLFTKVPQALSRTVTMLLGHSGGSGHVKRLGWEYILIGRGCALNHPSLQLTQGWEYIPMLIIIMVMSLELSLYTKL